MVAASSLRPVRSDADREGRPGVESSWQGSDEGDDVSGRGWAALNPDGTLEGHIYFHLGDDSAFRAERACVEPGIPGRADAQILADACDFGRAVSPWLLCAP